jgi:hypothetical protein
MDERTDPVLIITQPSESMARDRQQALGSWVRLARKAGWNVEVVDEQVDWSAGECGIADIEGLRYVIRVGPRRRLTQFVVPDGHMAEHVAAMVTGERSFPSRSVFALTVWAEPLLP